MNASNPPKDLFFIVLREEKGQKTSMVLIAHNPGDRWGIPQFKLSPDSQPSQMTAEFMLNTLFSRLEILTFRCLETDVWKGADNILSNCLLCECVISPTAVAKTEREIRYVSADTPFINLTDEAIAVLSLPFIRSRLS